MLRTWSGVLRQEEGETEGSAGPLFDKQEPKADPTPEALARLEKKVDDQNGYLAQFFQRAQQPRPQQPNPSAQDEQRKRLEAQFFERPAETTAQVAAHVAQQAAFQQAAQIRAEMHPMQVRSAKAEARNLDPDVFDKYGSDVEEWVMKTYGPEHHANEFVWKQGLNHVKASKFDEIAAYKAERKKAATAINAPSRRGYSPEESQGLSDDEREAARVLGLSEADYESARKGFHQDRTAPTEGRGMLQSAWSDVITLDRSKPRKRANG